MELKAKLKKLAEELGADFFGIANLSPAQETIENLWEKEAAQFPRAISLGIALPHEIVNQQPKGKRTQGKLDMMPTSAIIFEQAGKNIRTWCLWNVPLYLSLWKKQEQQKLASMNQNNGYLL